MLRGTGDSKTSSSQVVLGNSEVKINNDEFNIVNIGRSSNSMSTGHDDDDDEDRVGAIDDNNEVQRSFAGNRWPRQETLALLKIRSDMDVAFRDATVKVPLWDQISRSLLFLIRSLFSLFFSNCDFNFLVGLIFSFSF